MTIFKRATQSSLKDNDISLSHHNFNIRLCIQSKDFLQGHLINVTHDSSIQYPTQTKQKDPILMKLHGTKQHKSHVT